MRVIIVLALLCAVSGQFFQNRQRGRRPRPQQRQQGGGQGAGGPVDDQFGGHQYHYSWRHGGRSMTGGQAASYCRNLQGGWAAVSINDSSENEFIKRVITGERLEYIWTGGSIRNGRISWPSGGQGVQDWSHTGGARRAQPDNREGNEFCLAILNNFYRDGVKWHDVACSHRKPTICERG